MLSNQLHELWVLLPKMPTGAFITSFGLKRPEITGFGTLRLRPHLGGSFGVQRFGLAFICSCFSQVVRIAGPQLKDAGAPSQRPGRRKKTSSVWDIGEPMPFGSAFAESQVFGNSVLCLEREQPVFTSSLHILIDKSRVTARPSCLSMSLSTAATSLGFEFAGSQGSAPPRNRVDLMASVGSFSWTVFVAIPVACSAELRPTVAGFTSSKWV